jgi:hypothetical protein
VTQLIEIAFLPQGENAVTLHVLQINQENIALLHNAHTGKFC